VIDVKSDFNESLRNELEAECAKTTLLYKLSLKEDYVLEFSMYP